MAEKKILGTLSAGSSSLIHVVDQSEYLIRIESADNPKEYVEVFKNAIPTLIEVLEDVNRQVNRQ